MVNCPDCNAAIDVDEDELDEGDVLECEECGVTLRVLSLDPLELEADSDDDDLDDEDEDEDEDDEDEEDYEDEDDSDDEDDEDRDEW